MAVILAGAMAFLAACTKTDGASDSAGSGRDSSGLDGGGTGTPEGPCFSAPVDFQIGTGETQFEMLSDGDPLEVIHGTQDGHHILGSVRIQNIGSVATIHFQVVPLADGIPVSDQVYRLRLSPDPEHGDCAGQAVGLYAYLGRIDPGAALFLGEATDIRMTITTESGEVRTRAVQVTPFFPLVEH
jgi:hypothetical protein